MMDKRAEMEARAERERDAALLQVERQYTERLVAIEWVFGGLGNLEGEGGEDEARADAGGDLTPLPPSLKGRGGVEEGGGLAPLPSSLKGRGRVKGEIAYAPREGFGRQVVEAVRSFTAPFDRNDVTERLTEMGVKGVDRDRVSIVLRTMEQLGDLKVRTPGAGRRATEWEAWG